MCDEKPNWGALHSKGTVFRQGGQEFINLSLPVVKIRSEDEESLMIHAALRAATIAIQGVELMTAEEIMREASALQAKQGKIEINPS